MLYTLFLHYPEMTAETLGSEALQQGMQAFDSYARELAAAGVLVSADVLQPVASSTTVSMRNGALQVQDGPYADTKEQLGGTFVLDLPDLDAALAWAEKAPSVQWGTVEIRPSAIRFVDGAWTPSA
jgi:hypothetical protein